MRWIVIICIAVWLAALVHGSAQRDQEEDVAASSGHETVSNGMAPALQAAVDLAKQFEGLSLVPYHDPDGWVTIGYGHKIPGALRHGNLSSYPAIDTTTALTWLRTDMQAACGVVSRNVGVSLTPNEMAALCDFVFNEGAGRFAESTLLRKLNDGDKAAVPGELRRWVYGDGHVLEGLVRRREAEARLWARGKP